MPASPDSLLFLVLSGSYENRNFLFHLMRYSIFRYPFHFPDGKTNKSLKQTIFLLKIGHAPRLRGLQDQVDHTTQGEVFLADSFQTELSGLPGTTGNLKRCWILQVTYHPNLLVNCTLPG